MDTAVSVNKFGMSIQETKFEIHEELKASQDLRAHLVRSSTGPNGRPGQRLALVGPRPEGV